MKGNCEAGCKHCATKELYKRIEYKDENGNVFGIANEFTGYKHFCDKGEPAYEEWHERNTKKTQRQYKKDLLPCFEPNEYVESLNNMIEISTDILNKIKRRENG